MVEFSLRNSTGRPCLGEIQADCQPCCPFETDVRCLSMRYSRILGGKIEFSRETPPGERKSETGWRRGSESNSWLRFAGRSRFIGPQSAYSACLRQTESPKQESGRLDLCLLTKKAKILNALLSVAYGFSLLKSHP